MKVQAAVFRRAQEPLTIEQVELDQPRGREVLVRTVATGVCHSDLHVVDGASRPPGRPPMVLGHEGAGIVEAVGEDVADVPAGRSCGRLPLRLLRDVRRSACRAIPTFARRDSSFATTADAPRADAGRRRGQHVRRHRQLCRADAAARELAREDRPRHPARPGCAGRLRRAYRRGRGAADSRDCEAGQTVAVFGCGGVGLSIIQGARIGGARQIIARRPVRFEARDGAANSARPTRSTPRQTMRFRRFAR